RSSTGRVGSQAHSASSARARALDLRRSPNSEDSSYVRLKSFLRCLEKHSSERIRRSSRADIDMTKAIVEVARPLGISVHDHLKRDKAGHARGEAPASGG